MHVINWRNVWEWGKANIIVIMFQITKMSQYCTTCAFNHSMPKSMTTCARPNYFLIWKQWSQPSLIYTFKKLLEPYYLIATRFELYKIFLNACCLKTQTLMFMVSCKWFTKQTTKDGTIMQNMTKINDWKK